MTDSVIAEYGRRREYHTLDALRGGAAVAVVAFHYSALLAPFDFSGAYLAVDLFFLMSGFVIAHAYDARFERGLGATQFLLARICRLYPLFAIGVLIAAAGIAVALVAGIPMKWTWGSLIAATAMNAAFLPSPPNPLNKFYLYPLDLPAWSLFYELLVNFVFALTWRWLRGRALTLLIALAAIGIVIVAATTGDLDQGVSYDGIGVGLVRVTFSFFLGVAMLRGFGRWYSLRVPLPVVVALTLGLLLLNVPDAWRGYYDAACVLLLFPLLIWIAVHTEPKWGVSVCTFLGLISYPLYMLHVPAKAMIVGILSKILGAEPSLYAPWLGGLVIAGAIGASWIAARYFDPLCVGC